MRKEILVFLAGVLFCMFFAGCQGIGEAELSHIESVCLAGVSREAVMERTKAVLRGFDFVIEKYDVDSGYIVTKPLRGSQFVEFWRRDNVGGGNIAEANIQSIQRTAKIRFSEDGGRVCLKCEVYVRRLSMVKSREEDNVSLASGSYSSGNVVLRTLKPEFGEMAWIDLGAEPELEKKIVGEIREVFVAGNE